MTTTVLRAVKFVGEGIDSIKESDITTASIEILEVTAALLGPILVPMLIVYLSSQGY
jgi:hypothetical protein